ncbi:hypothetical protein NESM_000859200 [Novymonas esmeraldas]|uniref:Uncharacterized protein n=1 Tax=Novymonas esmeraldas TaxID=1808958 RepID=A0AAW0EYM2_9TRYP
MRDARPCTAEVSSAAAASVVESDGAEGRSEHVRHATAVATPTPSDAADSSLRLTTPSSSLSQASSTSVAVSSPRTRSSDARLHNCPRNGDDGPGGVQEAPERTPALPRRDASPVHRDSPRAAAMFWFNGAVHHMRATAASDGGSGDGGEDEEDDEEETSATDCTPQDAAWVCVDGFRIPVTHAAAASPWWCRALLRSGAGVDASTADARERHAVGEAAWHASLTDTIAHSMQVESRRELGLLCTAPAAAAAAEAVSAVAEHVPVLDDADEARAVLLRWWGSLHREQ